MKTSDIPRFSYHDINENVSNLLQKTTPKNVLEVGVGLGNSTFNILDNILDTCQVTSIDKFIFKPEKYRIDLIKRCKLFYKKAQSDLVIINDTYEHYDLYKWCVMQHNKSKNLSVISADIDEYILNEKNNFDFVYLDSHRHLPKLKNQLNFFKSSNVVCGTGFLYKHNKRDIKQFIKENKKTLFVDEDFWAIT